MVVGLELDDEIHLLAHQHIGVALRDLRVVPVVHADQFDALRGGGALQAGRDLFRELIVGALRGVSEPVGALLERAQVRTIEVLARLLDHAAPLQRIKQTECHALREAAPRGDLAKRQRLARRSERGQQLRRMHDGLHEIGITGCGFLWRVTHVASPPAGIARRIMSRRFAERNTAFQYAKG